MLHTKIHIDGKPHYLWISFVKHNQIHNLNLAWVRNVLMSFFFFITKEKSPRADRVAIDSKTDKLVYVSPEVKDTLCGFGCFTRTGMQPRGTFEHGLLAMRYAWETYKDTVFSSKHTQEFVWRLEVSQFIWNLVHRELAVRRPHKHVDLPVAKDYVMMMPIDQLSFREKLQRHILSPSPNLLKALYDHFAGLEPEQRVDVLQKLEARGGGMATLAVRLQENFEERFDRVGSVLECEWCGKPGASVWTKDKDVALHRDCRRPYREHMDQRQIEELDRIQFDLDTN